MKTKINRFPALKLAVAAMVLSTLNSQLATAFAQGTAFTYQGRLVSGGQAATGIYDLRFAIYDSASGGGALAAPLTNSATGVTNGLFCVTLDFGAGVFDGNARWLDIAVRTNGAADFTSLTPRQPLTPAPYALYAPQAGVAATANTASSVAAATVGAGQLSATGAPAAGQILGYNGSSLVWTNPVSTAPGWLLGGNSGTTPGVNFLGTTDHQPLQFEVNGLLAWHLDPTPSGDVNVVGGSSSFVAPTVSAGTVGGGLLNQLLDSAHNSTIAGGNQNRIGVNSQVSVIGGGGANAISSNSWYATIGGGQANAVGAAAANGVIAGGAFNVLEDGASSSAVGGGAGNRVSANAPYSAIGGGADNRIAATTWYSFLGGGNLNVITNSYAAVLAGGATNLAAGSYATVSGGTANQAAGEGAVVAGGERNTATGLESVIGGGLENHAAGWEATVAGGGDNWATADVATVGGGSGNFAFSTFATVAGGSGNHAGNVAFIGGGVANRASGVNSAIAGGDSNDAEGTSSAIGGGTANTNLAANATIGGGSANAINVGGMQATIAGGNLNSAGGHQATVPGGQNNDASGRCSFAAGYRARAEHDGAFVWADNSEYDFTSLRANIFQVRASGGVNFYSDAEGNFGVKLDPGAGAWTSVSDRNAKANFAPANGREILERLTAVPIETWNYKTQDASVRHIGPMAQDFAAAFHVGSDPKGICTVDADGVALAAIQGLNEKVESGKRKAETQIEELQTENTELKARLEKLERLLRVAATPSSPDNQNR